MFMKICENGGREMYLYEIGGNYSYVHCLLKVTDFLGIKVSKKKLYNCFVLSRTCSKLSISSAYILTGKNFDISHPVRHY